MPEVAGPLLSPWSPAGMVPETCVSVPSLCPRDLKGSWHPRAPLPGDVLQGLQQRLLLVLDAVFGAQGPHQRGDLVQVVPGHSGEEAGESVGGPGVRKCLSPPLAYTEASQAWEPCPSPSPHVPTGWG